MTDALKYALMATKEENKRLAEATGLIDSQIFSARNEWVRKPPMRLILEAELNRLVEENRTKLESCPQDKLQDIQGTIKGLRAALGIINKQEN